MSHACMSTLFCIMYAHVCSVTHTLSMADRSEVKLHFAWNHCAFGNCAEVREKGFDPGVAEEKRSAWVWSFDDALPSASATECHGCSAELWNSTAIRCDPYMILHFVQLASFLDLPLLGSSGSGSLAAVTHAHRWLVSEIGIWMNLVCIYI